MSVQELLTQLRTEGIRLYVDEGRLRCDAPREAVTQELRTRLSQHREALIAFLERGQTLEETTIPSWDGPNPAPASFAQERLWFHGRVNPDSPAYNLPLSLELEGPLDVDALWLALDALVARHDVLRTTFALRGGALVQLVAEHMTWPRRQVDLRSETEQHRNNHREQLLRDACHQPFDLGRGALARALLVRETDRRASLLLLLHHALADGPSLAILARELLDHYRRTVAPADEAAPPVPTLRYADFAAWQRDRMSGARLDRELDWWTDRLEGAPPALALPYDHARPERPTHEGDRVRLNLDPETSAAVRAACRAADTTPFAWFLTVYAMFLARLSGQTDLTVGLPIANRFHPELEGAVGLFVNTLVARLRLTGNPRFSSALEDVKAWIRDAFDHAETPFDHLVARLSERGQRHADPHRGPLFQVGFALETSDVRDIEAGPLRTRLVTPPLRVAKTDLDLSVISSGEDFELALDYDIARFKRETVRGFAERLRHLVAVWARRPELCLAAEETLTEGERILLRQLNDTDASVDERHTPAERVARWAARTPNAIAIHWEHQSTTYGELERRVAGLANALVARGVRPETRVAVCLPRTPDLIVALLAVQRAGAAYVPLDPAYPTERLIFCLRDSGAALLLTDAASKALVADWDGEVLDPSVDGTEASQGVAAQRPDLDNLAHVLYTSGSTGRPKGVAIGLRAVLALLDWAERAFPAEQRRHVLAATSVCFDLSVFEIFLPLTTGATVVLVRDALALAECRAPVTLINTVPSAMATLLMTGALPSTLRAVVMAGEPIPHEILAGLRGGAGLERVANCYGPSEDTTYSTFAWLDLEDPRPAPIGRPIDCTRVHLLDPTGHPVPPGAGGELCLAGTGLARGYLDRPALTAERFVPDPFATEPGARLYRTGDLARLRNDGQLAFLGRLDHQVKLRGFRIELGEIEARLRELPGVADVAVHVHREAGEPLLAAWLVAEPGQDPDLGELRRAMRRQVPDFMVPSWWGWLETLPRTPNGKLDRARLPLPGAETERECEPPTTESQRILADLWAEVLGHRRFDIRDAFFQIGGNSLTLTRLAARLAETHGIEPPLEVLFRYDTLADQAAWLDHALPDRVTVPVGGPDDDPDQDMEEGIL